MSSDILTRIGSFGVVVMAVVLLVALACVLTILPLWLRASHAGAPVSLLHLVAMKIRREPCAKLVNLHIAAVRAGIGVTLLQIETQYFAGGDVSRTVQAVIEAREKGLSLTWDKACVEDLVAKATGRR